MNTGRPRHKISAGRVRFVDQWMSCAPKNKESPDVSVKVGAEIYSLNRLRLALMSNYFEKLFTTEYMEKESELIEIQALDSLTFSAIIDLTNGENLDSLIDADSYVSLLLAMDYLQMEIDLRPFKKFIKTYTKKDLPFDPQMFELCHVICANRDYTYLERDVHIYLSSYLMDFPTYQEFLLLPPEHLINVIKIQQRTSKYSFVYEKTVISQICAKWIYQDVENRLQYFIQLVNAANRRLFQSFFRINACDVGDRLNNVEEGSKEEKMGRYFYQLLNGENFCCDDPEPENPKISTTKETCYTVNQIEKNEKWSKFVENAFLYDVTIKAEEKTYKLHRSMLKRSSKYFAGIFAAEKRETGSSICVDKDKPHVIDMDAATFDAIVEFIYFDDVVLNRTTCIGLLKAGKALKIEDLILTCCLWMKCNEEKLCFEDILRILDFIEHDEDYTRRYEYREIYKLLLLLFDCDASENLTNDIIRRVWNVGEILQWGELTNKCVEWIVRNLLGSNIEDVLKTLNKEQGEDVLRRFLDMYTDALFYNHVFYILQVTEHFEFEKLTYRCLEWMMQNRKAMSPENVIKILNFTLGKEKFDHYYGFFLCEHVIATWPNVNESLFCTISSAMLENMLASPNLLFDDPRCILDICAKWIVYDVENRYPLMPKIAFDINCNCMANRDDFNITEIPQDLNNCSEQSIRDKLWEILSANPLMPRYSDPRYSEKPVFISSYNSENSPDVEEFRCDIFDVDFNKIASLKPLQLYNDCLLENSLRMKQSDAHVLSATQIEDNLFMIFKVCTKYVFLVYVSSFKKLYSLASIPCRKNEFYQQKTILNCENQVYGVFFENTMMKYSVQMNRWEVISDTKVGTKRISRGCIRYTSDGTNLFRVFEPYYRYPPSSKKSLPKYVIELWKDSWFSFADLTNFRSENLIHVSNIENSIAVLLQSELWLFDIQSLSWRNFSVPSEVSFSSSMLNSPFVTNHGNSLLYVFNNDVYELQHREEEWKMKKNLPFEPYVIGNMKLIHRSVSTKLAPESAMSPVCRMIVSS
ncbi:uncharacterized protein LOC135831270 [Planococcus citri]|uniref:uncharacterized protein LOC135831270 n=1 Tax=Planococcus citri TaxID=170843 RepID=UPI0031FA08D7